MNIENKLNSYQGRGRRQGEINWETGIDIYTCLAAQLCLTPL